MLEPEEFKDCVKTYVSLHDEITAASRQLSELRKKREAIGHLIVQFMKSKNIDECELQDNGGKLVRRESKRTETLKKDHILAEIMPLVNNDADRAKLCIEAIFNKRTVEVKDVLSRTKR